MVWLRSQDDYFHKERVRPIYFACTPHAILETGKQCEDPLARSLYFFLYLTGCRINEATDFQKSRLDIFPEYYKIRLKTLKQKKIEHSWRNIIIPKGKYSRCLENKMWTYVWDYIKDIDITEKPFAKWKNMSEYVARKIDIEVEALVKIGNKEWIEKTFTKRFHPHLMRHFRAMHLADYYNMDAFKLCGFFGWRDSNQTRTYVNLKDLKDSFIQ